MSKSNYSKSQISFIVNQRKQGNTYPQIAENFEKKFGLKKSARSVEAIFSRNKQNFNLDKIKHYTEIKSETSKKEMISALTSMIEARQYVPSSTEFCKHSGFSKDSIARYFGSYVGLETKVRETNPSIFTEIIDESIFTEEAFQELKQSVKRHNRFVITTAVTGCAPHEGLKTLQSYCEKNKAKLLILTCSDPARTKEHRYHFSLNSKFPSDSIVFRDLSLNSNIFLSTIKLTAKQINPLTGLKRLTNRGSCILASPKQMLTHVPSSNKKGLPRALMTTGAITESDYRTEMYMSERTAYLAEDDHKLGALIVEIKDEHTFFSRRVQIDSRTGSFCDLNKKYHSNGKVEKIRAELIQQPDWHVLSTDPSFKRAAKSIVEVMKPEIMTVEDFFDGVSINPHERHDIISRAKKAIKGELSLANELKACSKEIDELTAWSIGKLVMKYGNHEDFLLRWVKTGEYVHDPLNHYEGVCLAKAALEDRMPFEAAMRERYPFKNQSKVEFLGINDSFKVNGIENGVHGHLGSGGKRNPSMEGLEAYGPVNTGHNHSGAIFRDVVRVGTATFMQLSYNDGASSWTHSLNIQHYDGSRQLITVINGEYCLSDILK